MSIRIIMAPLSGLEGAAASLETALQVGRMFEAHVEAFHVSLDPRDSVAYMAEGMTSNMIQDIMDAVDSEGHQRLDRARAQFDALRAQFDVPVSDDRTTKGFGASFTAVVGREEDLIARRGRLTDLIVAARSDSHDGGARTTLEIALLETGRPVLVAPPQSAPVIRQDGCHRLERQFRGGPCHRRWPAVFARRRKCQRPCCARGCTLRGAGWRRYRLPRLSRGRRIGAPHRRERGEDRRCAHGSGIRRRHRYAGHGRLHAQPLAPFDFWRCDERDPPTCRFSSPYAALGGAGHATKKSASRTGEKSGIPRRQHEPRLRIHRTPD